VAKIYKYIESNSQKLEVLEKGPEGNRIIILTGMGCSFDEWHEVTDSLSKTNQVIMFHRPGLGKSELGEEIRNTQAAVQDIHSVITHYGMRDPIYLVGHSYGGLCAQHFAKVYPELVKGLVLVDSTSVDLSALDELDLPVMDEESDESWIAKCLEYAAKTKEQLKEWLNPSLDEKYEKFPVLIQKRLLEFQVSPDLYKAMASEIRLWKEDADKIKKLGEFPDIPLVVIGRDKEYSIEYEENERIPEWECIIFEKAWEELIIAQSKMSSRSKLIFASHSGHAVYLDRPDVVIESIHKLIFAAEGREV
jgi:pimeloyl-ACP methyl ester carboxylesterase